MSEGKPVKVGARVEVSGKEVIGNVAYIGTTLFSSGNTTTNIDLQSTVFTGLYWIFALYSTPCLVQPFFTFAYKATTCGDFVPVLYSKLRTGNVYFCYRIKQCTIF